MKIKYIIFGLFLFVFAFGNLNLIPTFNLGGAGVVHAESGSSDDDSDSNDISDDDSSDDDSSDDNSNDDSDDESRNRYRYKDEEGNEYRLEEKIKYDGALGIPIRQEVRERLRIKSPGERMEIKAREMDMIRDFDGNDVVGRSDLRILLTNWGKCRFIPATSVISPGVPPTDAASSERYCSGDTNQDGVVDILDLEEIISSWNEDGDDNNHALEIIETCKETIGVDNQRNCFIKSLQEREIESKTERATIAWKVRSGDDISDDNSGKSVESRVQNYLKYMENMITRMYAAVERLEVLSQRIDSRITKLEEDGFDMTSSKNLLDDAQVKIDDAKLKISGLSDGYESIIEVDNPKDYFERIRTDVQNIRDILKDIHLSLIEVVKTIRIEAGYSEDEVESSSNSDSPTITN